MRQQQRRTDEEWWSQDEPEEQLSAGREWWLKNGHRSTKGGPRRTPEHSQGQDWFAVIFWLVVIGLLWIPQSDSPPHVTTLLWKVPLTAFSVGVLLVATNFLIRRMLCRFFGVHSWTNCRCLYCKTGVPEERHNWDECVCLSCGAARDQNHVWDGCFCPRCCTVRDSDHKWHGCVCSVCPAVRDVEHDMGPCGCKRGCGKEGPEPHDSYSYEDFLQDWDGHHVDPIIKTRFCSRCTDVSERCADRAVNYAGRLKVPPTITTDLRLKVSNSVTSTSAR